MLLALACLAAFVDVLRVLVWLADFVLVVLVVYDFATTPSPARMKLRRELPRRAGLSDDFVRVLTVEAGSERDAARVVGREIVVYEEFAPALEVRARHAHAALPSAASDPTGGPDRARFTAPKLELRRTYRSHRRGVHPLLDLRLRIAGRLGLVWRQARRSGRQTIEVEPALAHLSRTLAFAASERWRDLGLRRLRRRGGQMEFESLREHVRGDEVRSIDWKAFAKRGRPIVRQYQEERGQELFLVIDCGRRMAATTAPGEGALHPDRPTEGWTKLDHALDTALQLAAVALRQEDRVGTLVFDDRVRAYVAPGRGAAQLERLRDALFALQPSTHEADLGRALSELALRHRRRALWIVFSDVADPLSVERQRLALAGAARRQRILFAGLDDPALRALASGVHATASEDERTPLRAAALSLAHEREQALRQLAGVGVRVLDALPAESALPVLAGWLDLRRGS
ncbi:MAG: DUF58 domain-containing protein [Planctomycetota bacterium]